MNLHSDQLSGPKIKAFLKIFPILVKAYDKKSFEVRNAIKRINGMENIGIWCHASNKIDVIEKKKQEDGDKISLDLQNACHCFSGNTKSSIIDMNSGKEIQLLSWEAKMTYRIKDGAEELYKIIIGSD